MAINQINFNGMWKLLIPGKVEKIPGQLFMRNPQTTGQTLGGKQREVMRNIAN
jgi:hypothetical protein